MNRISRDAAVRVRFAPSPTGALHLGSAMVALANLLLARSSGGSFVLRIDDTDAARSTERDALDLLRLLRWLGIEWDEGPFRQSERADVYAAALAQLRATDRSYPCFCDAERLAALHAEQESRGLPPRYDGRCAALDRSQADRSVAAGAPHVLRLRVPERDVVIGDLVRGDVTIPAGAFGDPVLQRTDGTVGYLLASVVDDVTLAITHVVRGEDHLSNSAVQIVLFEALGQEPPAFVHLPLLRDDDGRKLSKRDPLGTLDELVDAGYLPTTVRRYLAELLGQGSDDPVVRGDTPTFVVDRVPTGAPRVDLARLESLGREDIAKLSLDRLLEGTSISPTRELDPLVRELAVESGSMVKLRGELRLVFDGPGPSDLPVVLAMFAEDDTERLERWDTALGLAVEQLRAELDTVTLGAGAGVSWAEPLVGRLKSAGREAGIGMRDLLQPLRIALTGTDHGPGIDLVLTALGGREVLRRVHLARIVLEERMATEGGGVPPLG